MKNLAQLGRMGLLVLVTFAVLTPAAKAQDDERAFSETVMATFRIKSGRLDDFLKLMPGYWSALRADDLVLAEPHILLHGEENGKPIVIEIFTWKNHDAPDHAPADIQSYWNKFHEMTEDRNGHSGIEFPEMTVVKSHS